MKKYCKTNFFKYIFILTLICQFLLPVSYTFAEEAFIVGLNQSRIIPAQNVTQVAVANPEIADVVVISNKEILVVGKKMGSTSLHIWRNNSKNSLNVIVSGIDTGTGEMIKNIIAYPSVNVTVANDKVILEGTVENQYEKNRAEKIATAYCQGEVINLLEMTDPKQVRIECRIIEVSTDKVNNLGISYGNVASISDGNIVLGTEGSFGLGQTHINTIDGGNVFGWFGSYADINAKLMALTKTGDAKILSQPYIITMSGEPAEILIGGEIPVPVNTTENTVSIDWREYGIKLNIEPTVQNNNAIDSKIQAEVSTLDYASAANTSANGVIVPGLKSRKADTRVQMRDGMTMAIGGLISSEDSKTISKIPLLGDIPVLGQFFRSTSKTKDKKEIVILLTPMLVDSEYRPVMSETVEGMSYLTDEDILRGGTNEK